MQAGKQKKSDVTRVFWPSRCSDSNHGLLVGWNVHSFTACVATVTEGVHLSLLKDALSVLADSSRYSHLFDECGGPPTLLGEYQGSDVPRTQSDAIETIRQTASFWITLDRQHGHPRLCDIHCCGVRYSVYSVTAQFVIYTQPRSSSYFSTIPFSPDLRRPAASFNRASDFEKALMQINESALVEHVLQDVIQMLRAGTKPALLLREEGNTKGHRIRVSEEGTSVHNTRSHAGEREEGARQQEQEQGHGQEQEQERREWVRGEKEGGSVARTLSHPLLLVRAVFVQSVMITMLIIHLGVSTIDVVLELPLGRLGSVLLAAGGGMGELEKEGVRLIHVSATARQIKLRLAQMLASPMISPSAWMLLQKKTSTAQTRAVTVSLNTTVCMLVLDLLLGVACACYMLTHSRATLEAVHALVGWHGRALQAVVRWLMGIPAGLKLNDNLDYCLGNLCIIGLQCYQVIYHWCAPLIPQVILGVAVSGIFGATVLLCVLSDLLSLATVHIALFYAIASKWHGVQTRVLSSLWRLFRGKKKNVLRGRIDACDFSLDQLLLGTILFTVLVFLFPTSFVYYLLFYLLKHAVGAVQAAARLAVSVLNHFPIFSLLLCLYDPTHLPGGAHLVLLPLPAAAHPPSSTSPSHVQDEAAAAARKGEASVTGRASYFLLSARPLPLSALFKMHKERFVAVLLQHSPRQILRSLLLAEQLPLITVSDSPTLTPISALELWLFMKALLFAPPAQA